MTNALLAAIIAILLISLMPVFAAVLLVLAIVYGCAEWRYAIVEGRIRIVERAKDNARNALRVHARLEGWPAGKLEYCVSQVNRVNVTQYKSLM